jgi:hypothetical protein
MKFNRLLCTLIAGILLSSLSFAAKSAAVKPPSRQYYQLIVYHLKDKSQEQRLDKYLSEAYVPFLHRSGVKTVGVFKTYNIDTATDKRVYVFLPFNSLADFAKISQVIETDKDLLQKGADYLNAKYDATPYLRKESILLQAFTGMPVLKKQDFAEPKSGRIYELRSYESPTELLNVKKVQMFNQEELEIFDRIGSKAVFYAQVLAGSRMPNLMYLTTYSSMASREEHWKVFSADPKWKRISALPEYQHVVNKADIIFLVPSEYSDL